MNSSHECTDCGRPIGRPGTCSDCLIENQPVPEKLIEDLKKGGKGK